jgi:hypothetical protein
MLEEKAGRLMTANRIAVNTFFIASSSNLGLVDEP